jgi:hypothetical protein
MACVYTMYIIRMYICVRVNGRLLSTLLLPCVTSTNLQLCPLQYAKLFCGGDEAICMPDYEDSAPSICENTCIIMTFFDYIDFCNLFEGRFQYFGSSCKSKRSYGIEIGRQLIMRTNPF